MSELFQEENISTLGIKENLLYTLQKNIIDEINEQNTQISGSTKNGSNLKPSLKLANNTFMNAHEYWGIFIHDTQNDVGIIEKFWLPLDVLDNDLFVVKGNEIYNKDILKAFQSFKKFNIIVMAEINDNGNIYSFEQEFTITNDPDKYYEAIVSCQTTETITIPYTPWMIGLILLNQPEGDLELNDQSFNYTSRFVALDDKIIFKYTDTLGEPAYIAYKVEVWNDTRMSAVSTQLKTFTFSRVLGWNFLTKEYHFGTYRTKKFHIHDDSVVFGSFYWTAWTVASLNVWPFESF